jgi:hypothetical protein
MPHITAAAEGGSPGWHTGVPQLLARLSGRHPSAPAKRMGVLR